MLTTSLQGIEQAGKADQQCVVQAVVGKQEDINELSFLHQNRNSSSKTSNDAHTCTAFSLSLLLLKHVRQHRLKTVLGSFCDTQLLHARK
jgi:hypothetical protein